MLLQKALQLHFVQIVYPVKLRLQPSGCPLLDRSVEIFRVPGIFRHQLLQGSQIALIQRSTLGQVPDSGAYHIIAVACPLQRHTLLHRVHMPALSVRKRMLSNNIRTHKKQTFIHRLHRHRPFQCPSRRQCLAAVNNIRTEDPFLPLRAACHTGYTQILQSLGTCQQVMQRIFILKLLKLLRSGGNRGSSQKFSRNNTYWRYIPCTISRL